jgi:hypothetical protein
MNIYVKYLLTYLIGFKNYGGGVEFRISVGVAASELIENE